MNFYFLLPDDFVGNYNDALRELIKYREEKELPNNPVDVENKTAMKDDGSDSLWNEFLAAIEKEKRFCGDVAFGAWDSEKNKWMNIS